MNDLATVKLNKFIPGENPDPGLFSTWTVYGKRRTGKSVFVKWNMQFYKHEVPWYWVFTKTEMNSHYASFLANSYILNDFSGETMYAIMDRQKFARKQAEETADGHDGKEPFNPRIGIVWDDYSEHADIRYNEALEQYYLTGRHFFSMNYFCTQHVKITPPAIRANTDIAVLFNSDYKDALETYAGCFAGKLPREFFLALFFEAVKEEHHFMAIQNDPNIPYQEKFYVGVAEDYDEDIKYVCGCPQFWEEDGKQLQEISSGKMKKNVALAKKLAKHVQLPKELDMMADKRKVTLKPSDEKLNEKDYKPFK